MNENEGKNRMTIDEAIFCMKSYLPDNELTCSDCRFYSDCQSDVAHKMAIEALQRGRKENGGKQDE